MQEEKRFKQKQLKKKLYFMQIGLLYIFSLLYNCLHSKLALNMTL